MVKQFFKPTAAGVLLALMILGFQSLLQNSTSTFTAASNVQPNTVHVIYGIPPMVDRTTTYAGGASTSATSIHWHWVLLVLAGTYCIAMPPGRFITGPAERAHLRIGWRAPVVTLLLVLGAIGVAAFVVSISASRWYWGYWMSPPALDARVAGARRVVSATHVYPVEAESEAPARLEISSIDQDLAPSDEGELDEEYPFRGRDLMALRKSGAMPPQPTSMPVARTEAVYQLLRDTGLLVAGESGGGTEVEATIFELESETGEPLLFISGSGRQVSNDHYPHYEFLFSNIDPAKPVLLSSRRFYYDVAGMEGVEWYALLPVVGVLGFLIIVPITVLVMAARRLREWRRLGGGFPVQAPSPPVPLSG